MKQRNNLLFTVLFSFSIFWGSLEAREGGFNQDLVRSKYYFVNTLAIYSSDSLVYTADSKLLTRKKYIELPCGKKYFILDDFFSRGSSTSDFSLPSSFEQNTTLVLTPVSVKMRPFVVLTRQNDCIMVMAGIPHGEKNGSLLIFDIEAFEKYMKTTYWYENLDESIDNSDVSNILGGFYAKDTVTDRCIAFGLSLDVSDANLLFGVDPSAVFPISIMEMRAQRHFFGVWHRITSVPNISYLKKSQKKPNSYFYSPEFNLISYDDLFQEKIITIDQMSDDMYAMFNQLIMNYQ